MAGEQLVAPVAPRPPPVLRVRRAPGRRVEGGHPPAPVQQRQGHADHCARRGGVDVVLRWRTTVRRYSVTMRGSQDGVDVAWGSDRRGGAAREHGSPSSGLRTYGLAGGFVLALAATA